MAGSTANEEVLRKRNRKPVPWEPYKGATKNSEKLLANEVPIEPVKLVKYPISTDLPESCRIGTNIEVENEFDLNIGKKKQVPSARVVKPEPPKPPPDDKEVALLRKELQIQRDINKELKTLLVQSLSEDVHCQITSLAEDKVRLAKNIDSYHFRASSEAETRENLALENQLWRSKFLAMAIRADDLTYSLHQSLRMVKNAQHTISEILPSVPSLTESLKRTISELLSIDVVNLYNKSPCDESRMAAIKKCPTNLTISCCKRCHGKEIKLL
ncbi:unnamed protein product [Bursaphelenchus xylophilus]|uniref:(pine wood nematode) hypothetical protein n=1 Tax=Bursaphelenchus xylophilus TaxID=6326 RepID=A0A1I7SEE1_BURXY|nr:unnamed protein product [Bursaphelenchus xylophilus]CAG9104054.1 unnamed protein product [Bursaphelenchus xylophilus]